MVLTASKMLPLGQPAPEFTLPDVVSGRSLSRSMVAGPQGLLVMFICRHCPFVKHIQAQLAQLGRDYLPQGMGMVAISANAVETHPEDAPDKLKLMAQEVGFTFPYLFDESQAIAKAYHGACTPDFFLFDRDLKLVYRGQLDDSRPGNNLPVTGKDLRRAMDALIAGEPIPVDQKPSIGCNIKWKPGNAP